MEVIECTKGNEKFFVECFTLCCSNCGKHSFKPIAIKVGEEYNIVILRCKCDYQIDVRNCVIKGAKEEFMKQSKFQKFKKIIFFWR